MTGNEPGPIVATKNKKSKTEEMEAEIESLQRANIAALAEVEELEDKIAGLEASKQRLLDKRADTLTEDVVLQFIKTKAEEFNPDKVLRGERCGPGVLRHACHRYQQLTALVTQAIAANEKK